MLELARSPSGKSDKSTKPLARLRLRHDTFQDARCAHIDSSDDLACIGQELREPEQQDQLRSLDRPSVKQSVRRSLKNGKIRQDFRQQHVCWAVQNKADRPASSVFDNEQDGLMEVGIVQRRTGDQELPSLHRRRPKFLLRLSPERGQKEQRPR